MLLKVAPTTTTDLGEFEAVISTESVDREKDIVSADAMVTALHKWNRPVPLSWNHSTMPEDIFGHVDPQSARNVNGEVVVNGKADLESTVGIEAWRSFKNGTVGFSFGYLIPDGGSTKRRGGGRSITELDVFEITATPTPMNNDTRVLAIKAMSDMTPAALLDGMIQMAQAYIANPPDQEDAGEMQSILDDLKELASDADDPADQAEDATGKALRRRADKVALEVVSGGAKPKATKPEPGPDLVHELREVKSTITELRDGLADLTKKANAPDPRTLRRRADTVALEVTAGGKPETVATQPEPEPEPQNPELQEVKAELAKVSAALEDLAKKADVMPRDFRRVDPLVAKADAVALEVVSGGESLRKPPRKTSSPVPRVSVAELRRQMHQATLDALTGGISHE
jgi:HK97 family phage prohead protease